MGVLLLSLAFLAGGPWSISPGAGIGHVSLGEPLSAVNKDLGKPDVCETAMGHVWSTWRSASGQSVSVYAVRTENDMEPRVQIVRVTSPVFTVRTGLRVGATQAETTKWMGSAAKVDTFQQGSARTELWDNIATGIAIELRKGKCTAIAIHPKGTPLLPIYAPYPLGKF